jgi:Predicted transcriptional regulators containing the CopG/Arc/MetJ DNA-binding domain and a metal-binding domain
VAIKWRQGFSPLLAGGYKLYAGVTLVRLVTVKMPDLYVRAIDELVKEERYSSRSEVIRVAVRELLKRELWRETLVADEVEVGELEAVEVS